MQEYDEFIDNIKVVREAADHFEVLIAGKDLTTAGDSWEPLTVIFEDVPATARAFFKRRHLNPILRRSLASIGL